MIRHLGHDDPEHDHRRDDVPTVHACTTTDNEAIELARSYPGRVFYSHESRPFGAYFEARHEDDRATLRGWHEDDPRPTSETEPTR